jgi:hypothetical protein
VARAVAAALSLASWSAATTASADGSERAEQLFQRARERMGQGDFATACPMLEESYGIDHGAGTLLALALCHEGDGKPATALREYRESLSMAVRANRPDRVMLAESHVQRLEATVPRIRFRLPSPEPKDLVVTLDDAPVDRAAMIAGVAVDPGTHTIVATSAEAQPWRATVEVAGGFQVVALPPALPTVPTVHDVRPPESHSPPPAPSSGLRVLGWGAVGVAAIGVGLGSFFGVSAFDVEARSKRQCTGTLCSAEGVNLNHEARTDATISDIAFAVGGVALAAGLFFLLRPSPAATSPGHGHSGAFVRVWAATDGTGVGITGPW